MSGIKLKIASVVLGTGGGGGGGGTSYYVDLIGKPSINSVTLNGNKSSSDLGLATAAQGTKADNALPAPSSAGAAGQVLKLDPQGNPIWANEQSGGASINDSTTAADKTWSSQKISQQLGTKQNSINDLSDIRNGAEAGATAYQKPSGGIPSTDLSSGVQASLALADSALQSHQDISGKADRVSGATSGNFASLDGNGNLVDSGHKHSDYLTEHQDISGKLDAPATPGTSGQVLTSDGSGGQSWQTQSSGSVTDVTVGGSSVVSNGVATIPAIPTVPTISTDILSDANSDAKTASPKAVKTYVDGKAIQSANASPLPSSSNPTAIIDNNNVLQLGIPSGAKGYDAVNPFKGWWPDFATLKAEITATQGDYAYVMPADPTDPVAIYEYDSTASSDKYWADSGRTFNPSNNQEFQSGESLNETGIDYTPTLGNTSKLITSDALFKATNYDATFCDLSELTKQSYWVYGGKWAASTGGQANRRIVLLPVNQGKYRIINVDGISANYTVLTSDTITVGATPDYATGYSWLATDGALDLTIPEGATHLCLQVHNDSYEIPWIVYEYGESAFAQTLGDNQYKGMSQKGTKDTIAGLFYIKSDVNVNEATQLSYTIVQDIWKQSWQNLSNRRCVILPVTSGKKYKLTNTASVASNYAILTTDTVTSNASVSYATGCGRETLLALESIELTIPSDGHYLYLLTHTDADTITWEVKEYLDILNTQQLGNDAFEALLQKEISASLTDFPTYGVIDLSQYQETAAALDKVNWMDVDNREGKFIPINAGDCFRLSLSDDKEATTYAFLKSNAWEKNTAIQYAYREFRHTLLKNEYKLLKAPYDAKYLFVTTYITADRTPIVERISSEEYETSISQSRLLSTILSNGKVVSDSEYKYAFSPSVLYINNHVKAVFAGNKTTTDGDATVNTNKIVLADYDVMTGQVTNAEMPAFTAFRDSQGYPLSGVTRAYNNCVYTDYTQNGTTDIGMFGVAGDGTNAGYSYCYKRTFDGTVYTRCHLVYGNNEVEFTGGNYRQMLTDMGWTQNTVSITKPAVDCSDIYHAGSYYYIVMCGFSIKGENTELPLVLLRSSDLATWTVMCRLGTNTHKASEIRSVVLNSKVYVIYRRIVNATNQATVGNGYGVGIYSLSDGTALNEKIIYSYIQSLPLICHANGNVWFGFNQTPYMCGKPSNVAYPYGRQQMAIYKVRNGDNAILYQYSVESPTGINYPTLITVNAKNNNTTILNSDRVYIAWSEDRRNLNYRQINNVCIANVSSVFGIDPLNGGDGDS